MIRLYPNKSQTEILNNWFGTARWTFNQVVGSGSLRASSRDPSKYATVKERQNFFNKKNSENEEILQTKLGKSDISRMEKLCYLYHNLQSK